MTTSPQGTASKALLDAYLKDLCATISTETLVDKPSVLISGAVRCGKTKVAKQVAVRGGFYHLRTDQIRNATYLHSDEVEKRRALKYLYRRLLLHFPRGILIDGTALMDDPCELPIWAEARGIAFYAIGYSFQTPEAKARDLLAYRAENRCWTKRSKSDAQMLRFARGIIRRSTVLRDFCDAHGLRYFDLDSSDFDAERDRIVRAIERDLVARETAGAPQTLLQRLQGWLNPRL